MSKSLTYSNINEFLTYSPETGALTRNFHWNPRHKEDMKIGSLDNYGYIKLNVSGVRHGAHQVAWYIMTGTWPSSEIDHINGIPSDNRWVNLRMVTHQENLANRANLGKNNKSGFVGVSFDSSRNKYRAYHTVFGKQKLIGRFETAEEAAEARRDYLHHL